MIRRRWSGVERASGRRRGRALSLISLNRLLLLLLLLILRRGRRRAVSVWWCGSCIGLSWLLGEGARARAMERETRDKSLRVPACPPKLETHQVRLVDRVHERSAG